MGPKIIISSDLGFVSDILSFISIMCVDKQIGGCKISSGYFSKIFLILRLWAYRPILNKKFASYF